MSFFGELSRRNVIRVAIAYAIVAWLIIQVADIVLETIGAPAWVMQTLMLLLALGFVVTVIFSWAYEVTPEGIKRESEVDRSASITSLTGRKLDRVIIGLLVAALAYFGGKPGSRIGLTSHLRRLSPTRQRPLRQRCCTRRLPNSRSPYCLSITAAPERTMRSSPKACTMTC